MKASGNGSPSDQQVIDLTGSDALPTGSPTQPAELGAMAAPQPPAGGGASGGGSVAGIAGEEMGAW
jgi:hypothetical protein